MDASVGFAPMIASSGMPVLVGRWYRSPCSLRVKMNLPPSSACAASLLSRSNSCWKNDLFTRESVGAIILGDVESQPSPITRKRSIGAVPFAANYRLIDVVASNCINSNISKIYTISQFNSTSLNSHVSKSYSRGGHLNNTFVDILAPYSSSEDDQWFQGTADSIRQCLWILDEQPVMDFLIVPGHHVYRMNYQEIIEFHRKHEADITISGSVHEGGSDIHGHGFIRMNDHNSVLNFKMNKDDILNETRGGDQYLSNMGMYILKRDAMIKLLTEYFPDANELEDEVILGAISKGMKVQCFSYDGHWEEVGSVKAFYTANMEIVRNTGKGLNLYDRDEPVYTLPKCLPPSTILNAEIVESIIGDGCIFKSCKIRGSVIGMRTIIDEGVMIEDSVVMGADIYHTDHMNSRSTREGTGIPIGIGKGSHIRKAIVDKNARIGKNVKLLNVDNVEEGGREDEGIVISGGIVIVIEDTVVPDGSIV